MSKQALQTETPRDQAGQAYQAMCCQAKHVAQIERQILSNQQENTLFRGSGLEQGLQFLSHEEKNGLDQAMKDHHP